MFAREVYAAIKDPRNAGSLYIAVGLVLVVGGLVGAVTLGIVLGLALAACGGLVAAVGTVLRGAA